MVFFTQDKSTLYFEAEVVSLVLVLKLLAHTVTFIKLNAKVL